MAENPRIEELRRRVLADPASIAFAALAEEFRRVGRYEEAVETCRIGLQRHPAYLSARVTLGRALIETGDHAGAREQFDTVLRSAPDNLAAIRGIAQINEQLAHSSEMDPHLAGMMHDMHVESVRAAAERVPVVSEPAPVEREIDPEPETAALSLAPEIAPAIAPGPSFETQPEPQLSMAPQPEPAVPTAPEPGATADADAPVDVFASFAPASSARAPAHDLSFDLSTAFSLPRKAERMADPPTDFSMPAPVVEPAPELVVERDETSLVEPVIEPLFQDEPALEPDPEPAIAAWTAPEILATCPEPVLNPSMERAIEETWTDPEVLAVQAAPALKPRLEPAIEEAWTTLEVLAVQAEPALEPDAEPAIEAGPHPEILATLARLERFLGAIESLRA